MQKSDTSKTTKSDHNSSESIMEKLLSSQSAKVVSLERGQEVEGEVVLITDKDIIIDLGTKSEGVISVKDIAPTILSSLKIGDKLKAFIIELENESGQIVLSNQRQTRSNQISDRGNRRFGGKWEKIVEAKNKNTKLNVRVVSQSNNGLLAEYDGIQGFLPSSEVSEPLTADLVGKDLIVFVLDANAASNRLIFSQKGDQSEIWAQAKQKHKADEIIKGVITRVNQNGVFVKLDSGLEGLIPASKLSGEAYETNQTISVTVDSVDTDRKRISLSPVITSTKGLIYK